MTDDPSSPSKKLVRETRTKNSVRMSCILARVFSRARNFFRVGHSSIPSKFLVRVSRTSFLDGELGSCVMGFSYCQWKFYSFTQESCPETDFAKFGYPTNTSTIDCLQNFVFKIIHYVPSVILHSTHSFTIRILSTGTSKPTTMYAYIVYYSKATSSMQTFIDGDDMWMTKFWLNFNFSLYVKLFSGTVETLLCYHLYCKLQQKTASRWLT